MRQYLRDSNGRLIGWREEGMIGRINGRDDAGRLVGWFDPVDRRAKGTRLAG